MEEIIKNYSNMLDHTGEHLSFETLAIYSNLKHQLSEKEKAFVELHIKNCAACKEKLFQIVEEDNEIEIIAGKKTVIYNIPTFLKYAVAASIVIAVGISIYLFNESPDKEIKLTDNDAGNIKIMDIPDSAATVPIENENVDKFIEQELEVLNNELYAVNTILENFIDRNLRSEKKISISTPKINDIVTVPILFEWKRHNYIGILDFNLVNNKNVKILSKEIDGNSFTLNTNLNKGLYYWKIKADGKIESVGKFLIK